LEAVARPDLWLVIASPGVIGKTMLIQEDIPWWLRCGFSLARLTKGLSSLGFYMRRGQAKGSRSLMPAANKYKN
jgi:hypothetical protein